MFKVIGLDQKEYGPIDAELVRQWLVQGRLHAQSLAWRAGEAQWKPLNTFPEFAALAVPPFPVPRAEPDAALSTIIPYKNAPALAAYYLGVFSVIPLLGLVMGIAAVILGILGLRKVKQHPEAKGKVHAWIGILAGGFFALLYLALVVLMIIGMAASRQ